MALFCGVTLAMSLGRSLKGLNILGPYADKLGPKMDGRQFASRYLFLDCPRRARPALGHVVNGE